MQQKKERNKQNPLWFIGAAVMFLLSQLKLLLPLLKLGKAGGAIISMAISVGAYAIIYPWQFAVGVVLLIFVHELGHVLAAKQKGLPVTAPVFIPFLGAMISMKRHPRDAVTEAYLAFGGPLLGTIGAMAVFGAAYVKDSDFLYTLSYVGFFINLLNLLPIHPLDGGRISTAVTRWLWLVGLIGGLAFIIYRFSPILMLIWALFAYDLYKKYVKNRKHGEKRSLTLSFMIDAEPLIAQGYIIPGTEHKRDLFFTTYTDLKEEQQLVDIYWDSLDFRGTVPMSQPSIIHRVRLMGLPRVQKENGLQLEMLCLIDYSVHENDRYYEVPTAARWKFGAAYLGLAVVLLYMMWQVHELTGINF